jgi:hypothetical protein
MRLADLLQHFCHGKACIKVTRIIKVDCLKRKIRPSNRETRRRRRYGW